mgnify:CR=1 FL=1
MLEANDFYGKFEFRPLEPGFATTVGNALRRILLSSLEGFAINCIKIAGVMIFMTHGHKHGVKTNTAMLIAEARAMHAQAALYGHTHVADCRHEADGLWVLNPGSCGYGGGSAGLLEIENAAITRCRILLAADLEETL